MKDLASLLEILNTVTLIKTALVYNTILSLIEKFQSSVKTKKPKGKKKSQLLRWKSAKTDFSIIPC